MHGEDVERVVGFHVVLQLGGEIAADGSHSPENNRRPCRHVTRGWRDSNETRDGAGAETHGGPFAVETVVEQDPREAADGSGEVGDHAGHDSAHVRTERRPAVKTEPADPEEDGADHDMSDVVRPVRQPVKIAVASSFSEHDGVSERGSAGRDVHGGSTGEVKAAHFIDPAGRVPGPAGDGVVDDGCPDEHEDDAGEHAAAVSGGANCQGWSVGKR